MTETNTTIEGRAFATSTTGLADSSEFQINPADTKTNALEIHNIAHGGSVDVDLATSSDDTTFTEDARVTLDSFTGEGISQGNQIEVNDNDNVYLVITNTSGGPIDVIVTGKQVSQ